VQLRIPIADSETTVRIRLRNSFAFENPMQLPELGAKSSALKVVAETWTGNRLTLQLSGIAGKTYELPLYGSARISSVDGAELVGTGASQRLRVHFPAGEGYVKKTASLAFASK
jgi:hypothetical protein